MDNDIDLLSADYTPDNELEYQPEKTSALFHQSKARRRWLQSSVGLGKTTTCVNDMFLQGYTQHARRGRRVSSWCVTRPTYGDLESIVIPEFLKWFPDDVFNIKGNMPYIGELRMELPDGTFVHADYPMVGLNKRDSLNRISGANYTGGYINELGETPYMVYEKLEERVERSPSAADGGFRWGGIIGDLNQVTTKHWFHKKIRSQVPDGHEIFILPAPLMRRTAHSAVTDLVPNPDAEGVIYQPKGFRYWLDLMKGKDEKYIRQRILNEVVSWHDGDPVHPLFRNDYHVSPYPLTPDRTKQVMISFDWGYRGPAAVLGQWVDDQLVILESITGKNMSLTRFLKSKVMPRIVARYKGCRFVGVGDPSGGKNWAADHTPFTTVNNFFYDDLGDTQYVTYKRITNAIADRVEAVDKNLGIVDKVIHCPVYAADLIDALSGEYYWEIGDDGEPSAPMKGDASHVADANHYLHLFLNMLLSTNEDTDNSTDVYYPTGRYG